MKMQPGKPPKQPLNAIRARRVLGLVLVSLAFVSNADQRSVAATSTAAHNSTVAECSSADSGPTCLARELQLADEAINSVYQKIMSGLDPIARKDLRTQQRGWLKSRDASCALSTKVSDRREWIDYVLADDARAVCVIRFTKERLAQLVELDKGTSASQPPRIEATIRPSRSNLDYVKTSLESHEKGKWYFEVQIDH